MSQNETAKEITTGTGAGQALDAAQVEQVGGGLSCSPGELIELTNGLRQAYDNLVDFTSYVIERVVSK